MEKSMKTNKELSWNHTMLMKRQNNREFLKYILNIMCVTKTV